MKGKLITFATAALAAGALALGTAAAASASTAQPAHAAVVHASKPKAITAMTGSCGPQCPVPYFPLASGFNYVQKDSHGLAVFNNPVNVNFAATSGAAGLAEDWLPHGEGNVVPQYCPSTTTPVTPAVDPIFSAHQCALIAAAGLDSDTAYSLHFEPLGVDSHLCTGEFGDPAVAVDNWRVRLVTCGTAADSIWILKPELAGTFIAINGASSNFDTPEVLTEATGAVAYQRLMVDQLNVDSNGIIDSRQLVKFRPGL